MKYRPFIYALVLAILPASAAQPQSSQSIIESQGFLNLGEVKERRLGPDTTHVWFMNLEAGQYAAVEVEQKGIDVAIYVVDPKNNRKNEFDTPASAPRTEQAMWIANTSGTWKIEIAPVRTKQRGSYEIKWSIQREATALDRQVITVDSLGNLASYYYSQRKYTEAESIFKRRLAIQEQILVWKVLPWLLVIMT